MAASIATGWVVVGALTVVGVAVVDEAVVVGAAVVVSTAVVDGVLVVEGAAVRAAVVGAETVDSVVETRGMGAVVVAVSSSFALAVTPTTFAGIVSGDVTDEDVVD